MFLINFICANLPFKKDEKMDLLSINSLRERTYHLLEILNREVQLAEIKASILMRAREDIDQQQREYFLHQQMKNIQSELGEDGNNDATELEDKASKLYMPTKVAETFKREVEKFKRINPQSPDYNMQLNYLQTIVSLPWGIDTPSGSGQDFARPQHRRGFRTQVCAHLIRWCTRRGRNSWSPSHLHRCYAWPYH